MQSMRSSSSSLFTFARRGLATAQQSAPVPAAAEKAVKKYRRKTLAEVAAYLPEDGVGARFTRLMWLRNGYENSWWTITKVTRDGRGAPCFHGRLTWRGAEPGSEKVVNTQQKPGWRFILDDTDKQ